MRAITREWRVSLLLTGLIGLLTWLYVYAVHHERDDRPATCTATVNGKPMPCEVKR